MRVPPWLARQAPDLLSLVGTVALVRGVALLSAAAAWIVAGVLALGLGLLAAKREASP